MTKNEVSFARKIYKEGYTQKQITIILKANKSTISRIINWKTYKAVYAEDYTKDRVLENNKAIFDIITECREIPGIGPLSEQDKIYIRLLRHCDVDYDKARKLYYDIPAKKFRPIWDYTQDVNLEDFNSKILGIDKQDYLNFINKR